MRKYKSVSEIIQSAPPKTIREALLNWPDQDKYYPSPSDWRNEILYFLLPDRFSDGNITGENMLLRRDSESARINSREAHCGNWQKWCLSGSSRFQGGNIQGITLQLDYLEQLGISAIWVGPVFRQRIENNTYHGYGIQDFFDVDPRFGTRADLVELVREAHNRGIRIILDIIFNHSGTNWVYDGSETANIWEPPFKKHGYYETMRPLNGMGLVLEEGASAKHPDDFVWPAELRSDVHYWKKGSANLAESDYGNPMAEHKTGDFCSLRAFHTVNDSTLSCLITIYQYWMSLTDCDGFRIDTVKHVSGESARNWCNGVTEYGDTIGKTGFLLLGEVAGGEDVQDYYMNEAYNLDATLDIGDSRMMLRSLGQGLTSPEEFFLSFSQKWNDRRGSHRRWGDMHVSVLDDHDHVMGEKLRFSVEAPCEHQVVVPVAIQLFSLGIPCIYYGTEQALRGLPRDSEQRGYISTIKNADGTRAYDIDKSDWLLREAMFGPLHPLKAGYKGSVGERDTSMPGFGVEGTCGKHVFDTGHPAYLRIKLLADIRRRYCTAARGRQYMRTVSVLGGPYSVSGAGELLAWSRILDQYEMLIVINPNSVEGRGGRISVDSRLTSERYYAVADTRGVNDPQFNMGQNVVDVQYNGGNSFVDLGVIAPCEVIVLANHYIPQEG